LGEIIRCFTTLRKNGGHFKLLSPNKRVIDLLSITKLLNVFDCFDNESSAIMSFS
jgi:anti-sigma B factor antagonist